MKVNPGSDIAKLAEVDAVRAGGAKDKPAAGSGLDTERVEEITAAMRRGKFMVNAEVVADRLIEGLCELRAKRSSSATPSN